MNHVTFLTALQLKAAGFPQTGHAWPQKYYWHRDFSDRINVVLSEAQADTIEGPHTIAYAPTATELLQPDWFLLKSGTDEWLVFTSYSDVEDFRPSGQHSNPAEAAASAWLRVNATKTTETI